MFNTFVSLRQIICDASKFGSTKIFLKCKFKKWVLSVEWLYDLHDTLLNGFLKIVFHVSLKVIYFFFDNRIHLKVFAW